VALAASGPVAQRLQLLGRVAEVAGVGAFVVSVWSRVRPSGISAM
jgi:hypothetical protein